MEQWCSSTRPVAGGGGGGGGGGGSGGSADPPPPSRVGGPVTADETHAYAWWYSFSVSDKQTLLRVYGYAYSQWRISLLTCCRYVATPGLASSARTIVRCLKPNGLGTRPRSSIPLRVRTYYVRERNLSKEESGPSGLDSFAWRQGRQEGLGGPGQTVQLGPLWSVRVGVSPLFCRGVWKILRFYDSARMRPIIKRPLNPRAPVCARNWIPVSE